MRLQNRFQTTLVLERHDDFANFQHINKCGSEPARDGAASVNLSVNCYTAIASRRNAARLLPQG